MKIPFAYRGLALAWLLAVVLPWAAGHFADVRLVGMERQRDGGLLTFRIEASL